MPEETIPDQPEADGRLWLFTATAEAEVTPADAPEESE